MRIGLLVQMINGKLRGRNFFDGDINYNALPNFDGSAHLGHRRVHSHPHRAAARFQFCSANLALRSPSAHPLQFLHAARRRLACAPAAPGCPSRARRSRPARRQAGYQSDLVTGIRQLAKEVCFARFNAGVFLTVNHLCNACFSALAPTFAAAFTGIKE